MSNSEILDCIKNSFKLKAQGFYKPAIEMLYKALSIEPDNLEILAQLAHLYKLLENDDRAIYYIEKVLELDSNHLDCLQLLKDIYLDKGNLKEALTVADSMVAIESSPENLAVKIFILNELNDFDSIIKLQESVSEVSDVVLCEIARAYYLNNNVQKSIELLEQAYENNNKNLKVIELLSKVYFELNEFEKSKVLLEEIIKISPTVQSLNYLGQLAIQEQDCSAAVKYFYSAYQMDERNPSILFNLASAYFMIGDFDNAIKYAGFAVAIEPDNLNYQYSLAYFSYNAKDFDRALDILKLIQKKDENHYLSKVLNAMITAQQGRLFEAKEVLEELVAQNQSDDFCFSALSFVSKELDDLQSAKKYLHKALELKIDSLNYLIELAEIETALRNYDSALELIERILAFNDKFILAYVLQAKIKTAQGDIEGAFESAQEIIELDSNTPEGYYYNALALFSQGDVNFAIESLKKAISLDLNNATLYSKMSEFYVQLSDFKMAYEWSKEAADIDERNYYYKWTCAKLAAKIHNEEDAQKWYSQAYRIANFDNDLKSEYAKFLTSIGKSNQAEKLFK